MRSHAGVARFAWYVMLLLPMFCLLGLATGSPARADDTYVVKPGDNLAMIADSRYGDRCYLLLIAIHNNMEHPARIKAGQVLKIPPLEKMLADEGLVPLMKDEVAALTEARSVFMGVEGQLWGLYGDQDTADPIKVPDAVKKQILSAADLVDKAAAGFAVKKKGIVEIPTKTIGQLKSLSSTLRGLLNPESDYSIELNMVHQHFTHAMLNMIKWSRAGFK